MQLKFKNNFVGYFKFYYGVVGKKLLVSISLSIVVTLLDGVGLAMFIPLMQSVSSGQNADRGSMGHLHYITDAITKLGFPLTLSTILVILALLYSIKGVFKF